MKKFYRFWSVRMKTALTFILALAMSLSGVGTLSVSAQETSNDWIGDGIYYVTVNLRHSTTKDNTTTGGPMYSMGNYALRGSAGYNERNTDDTEFKSTLIVENGKGTLLVEYMPMGFLGRFGYLLKLNELDIREYNAYGLPKEYTAAMAMVLTEHRNTDGSIAEDAFNKEGSTVADAIGQAYPRAMAVSVELPASEAEATWENSTLVQVYVPVMASISPTTGTQFARLCPDYDTLEPATEEQLNQDVNYWLYRAMTTEGSEESEAYGALQTQIARTKAEYSNVVVSVTGEANNIVTRVSDEPDADARAASVSTLKSAIQAVKDEAAQYWDGTTTSEPSQAEGVYQITNAQELAWFRNQVNNGSGNISGVLMNDIDLNHQEWIPIGIYGLPFSGMFDGGGYSVSNMSIEAYGPGVGLFGNVNGSAVDGCGIKNLTVNGNICIGGNSIEQIVAMDSVGGVVGYCKSAVIENCTSNVNIQYNQGEAVSSVVLAYIGGIVGYADGGVTMTGCVNNGQIISSSAKATSTLGGIVGRMEECSSLNHCVNTGSVDGSVKSNNNSGGLIGNLTAGRVAATVSNSYNTGAVNGSGPSTGSIVGYTYMIAEGAVTNVGNVYNMGAVTGTDGGSLMGTVKVNSGTTLNVENAYSTGSADYVINTDVLDANGSLNLSHVYALEGSVTNLYSSNQPTSAEDAAIKTSDWLKSDEFFESIRTTALSKDIYNSNGGYPLLAEQADYSNVTAALAKVPDEEGLKLCSEDSVTALQKTLEGIVLYMSAGEQETVNGYPAVIEEAVNRLEYKAADYTAVEAAIAKIPQDISMYTSASVQELEAARAAVEYGKDIREQAVVDAYAEAIENAVNALKKLADYSKVDEALASVPADMSVYTDDTAAEVNRAVAAVNRDLAETEQSTVDSYAKAIENAVKNLTYKSADYTAVNEAVAQVNALDASLYENFSALEAAVAAVDWTKNITEQEAVNQMAQNILNAIAALEYSPADYTAVKEALAAIPEDLTVYTQASVDALTTVVNAIDYGKTVEEQEIVNGYPTLIYDAIAALEALADYSEVDAAIAAVPEDMSGYTEATAAAVKDAVNGVVRGLGASRQTEVDAMAEAIRNAVAALELKDTGNGGNNTDDDNKTGGNGNTNNTNTGTGNNNTNNTNTGTGNNNTGNTNTGTGGNLTGGTSTSGGTNLSSGNKLSSGTSTTSGKSSVKTGDETPVGAAAGLCGISVLALAVVFAQRKKSKKHIN